MTEDLLTEVKRLRQLVGAPDHGTEYAIVCHYKNQMQVLFEVVEKYEWALEFYSKVRCLTAKAFTGEVAVEALATGRALLEKL